MREKLDLCGTVYVWMCIHVWVWVSAVPQNWGGGGGGFLLLEIAPVT